MTSKLLPRVAARGTDFCGKKGYHHIIRSDVGYYLYAYNLDNGDSDPKMYPLHPSCAGGDHYFATKSYYYIIKGDKCRRVSDMTKGSDAIKFQLHKEWNSKKNKFFAAKDSGEFYIISNDTFFEVMDLQLEDGVQKILHANCKGGLYYWATGGFFFMLKALGDWGVEYHRTKDLETDAEGIDFAVHPPFVCLLPGGLSVKLGPPHGSWSLVKSIKNSSNIEIPWRQNVTKKIGYVTKERSEIQHSWSIESKTTIGAGGLTKLFMKAETSLTASYSGSFIKIKEEDWSEETTTEEEIRAVLRPGQVIYIWQYRFGMGETDILSCRNIALTTIPTPPEETRGHVPLSKLK